MVIFTYLDYLKYSRIINNNHMEYMLMEEKTKYIYDKKEIKHKHDKTFRKILDNKKEFIIFINNIFNLKEKLEEKKIEKYNRKFVSVDYKNQEADIIYKIKDKETYILVEHQTKIDYKMPIRILQYEMEIIRSRMSENEKIVFPTIIPIVLYTGRRRWNASINLPSQNSEIAKYRGLKKVEYNLIDINNYEKKELLEEKSILTKIMILEKSQNIIELKINTEKIVSKVFISKEYNTEQKTLLLNIIENTLNNIVEDEKIIKYKNKLKGEKNMLALYDMVEEEKMNSYRDGVIERKIQGIIQGKKEGKKEGKIEGKKEGKKEGKIEGKLDGIKMIARKMLKMKIDKDTIMQATGLKEEELEKLKK